jgi:hypothetical protein
MKHINHSIWCLLTAGAMYFPTCTPGLAQQGPFIDDYVWRNAYRVGQAVEKNPGLSPGLNNIAWIQCVVTHNSPNDVMRINCQPFDGKSYYAGSTIVSSETDIVPLPATVPMRARPGDWVEVQQYDLKWERMQVTAVANGRAIVRYEWDKEGTSTKVVIAKFVRGGTAPPPPPAMPRSLAGTYWSMMAMTKRGEAVRESSNPPDVEFTRKGTWGILRYGGSRIAGRYRIQGDILTMVYDEGQPYATYRMMWQPQQRRLELVSTDYTMRLKFLKPIDY